MTPHERPADVLAHLMRFWKLSGAEVARQSAHLGPLFAVNANFIFNQRKSDTIPNLYHLYAISEAFQVRLGDVFGIFGIDLDLFLEVVDQLNRHRTRLIETCPFGRNRMVYVPAVLGPEIRSKTTASLWELIPEWQEVPLFTIRDAAWRDRRFRYGQLGVWDTNSAPDIPPGAFVQIRVFEPDEIQHLDPNGFYFVQHPRGYTVCRCRYKDGWLELFSRDPSFNGLDRLRYGRAALILGKVTAFAALLPTQGYRRSLVLPELKKVPHAIVPWEHRSLRSLFGGEYARLGVTLEANATANEVLRNALGIGVSSSYARKLGRLQHSHFPHAYTALLGTAVCGVRISDMLRSCQIPLNNPNKFDLEQILSARSPADLPRHPVSAPSPRPAELWNSAVEEFNEWPLLISRLNPDPRNGLYEIMRLYQGDDFSGLDPLLRSGSLIAIDGTKRHIPDSFHDQHANERDWARTIHVLRFNGRHRSPLLCGYVQATQKELRLISHPDAHIHSIQRFPRSAVSVIGSLAGVMSTL